MQGVVGSTVFHPEVESWQISPGPSAAQRSGSPLATHNCEVRDRVYMKGIPQRWSVGRASENRIKPLCERDSSSRPVVMASFFEVDVNPYASSIIQSTGTISSHAAMPQCSWRLHPRSHARCGFGPEHMGPCPWGHSRDEPVAHCRSHKQVSTYRMREDSTHAFTRQAVRLWSALIM